MDQYYRQYSFRIWSWNVKTPTNPYVNVKIGETIENIVDKCNQMNYQKSSDWNLLFQIKKKKSDWVHPLQSSLTSESQPNEINTTYKP